MQKQNGPRSEKPCLRRFLNNKGADQHVHLHRLISSFGILFLERIISRLAGAQWLSGRVLDLILKGHRFVPHQRHCVVSLSKNINPSLVLVQLRKTRPYIAERFLMRGKESNQSKETKYLDLLQAKFPFSS